MGYRPVANRQPLLPTGYDFSGPVQRLIIGTGYDFSGSVLLIIVIEADADTIYVLFQSMTSSTPSTMEKPDIETVRAVVHKILVMYPEGVTREELLSKILYFIMLRNTPM